MDVEGQPLLNESMMINLEFDNLGLSHLDFYNLETLVHKLPNSPKIKFCFLAVQLHYFREEIGEVREGN